MLSFLKSQCKVVLFCNIKKLQHYFFFPKYEETSMVHCPFLNLVTMLGGFVSFLLLLTEQTSINSYIYSEKKAKEGKKDHLLGW